MPRFSVGDRVQLAGEIARFYSCVVGVVVHDGTTPSSVLNQLKVRLADGTTGVFFDFQLQIPPAARAQVIFDSSVSTTKSGTRGTAPGRHVQMASREVELHLKITSTGSTARSVVGQVTVSAVPLRLALVTLLAGTRPLESKATDDSGEFQLNDVSGGELTLEVFAAGRRVLAFLSI